MALVDVKVFYVEMLAPFRREVAAPRGGLTVMRAERPTVAFYRFLYNSVGQDYHWRSRGILSDAHLAVILSNPRNELYVLYVDGTPAGFAELDLQDEGNVELVQFGLIREFIGQGLGKWFLQWVVDLVWGRQPRRFWLHTCTLDHASALPNYLKGGFSLYKEERIQRDI